MKSLAHKLVGLGSGMASDRRPQGDDFIGINWDSPQAQGLAACFPMWNQGGAEIDLVNGYVAYPSNILSYNDPQMGWVYWGDNGGTPRGGGAPARPRFLNVGAFSKGQSGSTTATGYPASMDTGANATHTRPAGSATWTAWVKLVSPGGYILQGTDIQQTASGGNNPPNAYVTSFASNGGSFPGSGFGIAQQTGLGSGIFVELDIDGGNFQRTIIGFTPINDGNWHLIAGVYESAGGVNPLSDTGGRMSTYVDGVLDCTDKNNNYDVASPVPTLESWIDSPPWGTAIGADTDFLNAQWIGLFCDFRFYARALTAADLQAMFNPSSRWELYQPRKSYSLAKASPLVPLDEEQLVPTPVWPGPPRFPAQTDESELMIPLPPVVYGETGAMQVVSTTW